MKLKDKKIDILKPIVIKDSEGFTNTTLEPVYTSVWAYFRHLSGREIYAAEAFSFKDEVLFQVNYNREITPGYVVRYNGILYDITRVDVFEGYKQVLTLYCSKRP